MRILLILLTVSFSMQCNAQFTYDFTYKNTGFTGALSDGLKERLSENRFYFSSGYNRKSSFSIGLTAGFFLKKRKKIVSLSKTYNRNFFHLEIGPYVEYKFGLEKRSNLRFNANYVFNEIYSSYYIRTAFSSEKRVFFDAPYSIENALQTYNNQYTLFLRKVHLFSSLFYSYEISDKIAIGLGVNSLLVEVIDDTIDLTTLEKELKIYPGLEIGIKYNLIKDK